MSVDSHRQAKPSAKLNILFAGKPVACTPELSVAAALTRAGERVFRTTPTGAGRGIFCGMGVCQDCVVTVDGMPNQRACMTIVRDGMAIEPQAPQPRAIAGGAVPRDIELAPDLLVIGGGPAGLAAAAVAAECGLTVVLIDERAKLGGQYYKQPTQEHDASTLDRQFRNGMALIARTVAAGAQIITGVSVWAASGPDEIMASGAGASYTFRPKLLVLATGAYERGVPLPGWTLPGFMTTGAAQTLLRSYDTMPGQRVLLAGNGPLNLQVAVELQRCGCTVVALAEASARPGMEAARDLGRMVANAPDLVLDGIRYVTTLRRTGVPIFHRHAVIRAEGQTRVERAVIAAIGGDGRPIAGSEKSFDVDTVCVGFGFLPSNEISRTIGCKHQFDERRGHLVVERDDHGRSSISGVWVIGDGGGLGGARVAESMGSLAGVDCARSLGRSTTGAVDRIAAASARLLHRNRRFQEALWRIYRAPRLIDQLATRDTLICRCEEVSLGAVEDAIAGDIVHIGGVKRVTRAGMGRCQGRYCASLISEITARRTGRPVDELSLFAPRIPFKPLSIAQIAPAPPPGPVLADGRK